LLKRVLIANRGEIAIRVARAAAALGMDSVGVYAEADVLALHTRVTTESRIIDRYHSPSSDPVRAYLDAEALIEIAKASRCDCVHPGYGFLSENPGFAQRCAEERHHLHRSEP
jgi:pyruvate carboxylase